MRGPPSAATRSASATSLASTAACTGRGRRSCRPPLHPSQRRRDDRVGRAVERAEFAREEPRPGESPGRRAGMALDARRRLQGAPAAISAAARRGPFEAARSLARAAEASSAATALPSDAVSGVSSLASMSRKRRRSSGSTTVSIASSRPRWRMRMPAAMSPRWRMVMRWVIRLPSRSRLRLGFARHRLDGGPDDRRAA